jgi:hypothetical protein
MTTCVSVKFVSCGKNVESKNHLFIACPLTWEVLPKAHKWFDLVMVSPKSLPSLFESFLALYNKDKQKSRGVL